MFDILITRKKIIEGTSSKFKVKLQDWCKINKWRVSPHEM